MLPSCLEKYGFGLRVVNNFFFKKNNKKKKYRRSYVVGFFSGLDLILHSSHEKLEIKSGPFYYNVF
jgi:hypothetical protein